MPEMTCECGANTEVRIRVGGSNGIIRVAHLCRGCWLNMETVEEAKINELTIHDIVRLLEQLCQRT